MADMIAFKVAAINKMISIDNDEFSYGRILDMYTTGDGVGLQLNDETDRDRLDKMCNKVSGAIKEYLNWGKK